MGGLGYWGPGVAGSGVWRYASSPETENVFLHKSEQFMEPFCD